MTCITSNYFTKKRLHKKEVILFFILCRALMGFDQARKQHKGPNYFANKSAIGTLKGVPLTKAAVVLGQKAEDQRET